MAALWSLQASPEPSDPPVGLMGRCRHRGQGPIFNRLHHQHDEELLGVVRVHRWCRPVDPRGLDEPLDYYMTNNMFDETKLYVAAKGGRRRRQ